MKVTNCWDKCFLCLTNFNSGSASSSCGEKKSRGKKQKRKEINEKPNFHLSVLIKYLLGTWDQTEIESLLQRIRLLQLPSSSSSEGCIKFCDKCQDSARRISHLHMELEVVQMKIVDILCSVRKTVIDNSNGNDGTSGMSLEEFTEETQEILDTLHVFQAAVVKKSKESIHVPLVYIEKFTGCKNLKTNRASPPTPAEEDKLNLIKTEPAADSLEEILSDFGDDYDSQDYDYAATPISQFNERVGVEDDDRQEERMDLDTNNDVNITPRVQDQGRPLTPSPPLSETDFPPAPRKLQKRSIKSKKKTKKKTKRDATRKARSAAQTAVKRIADVKNQFKPSFQYRPRKAAKKAKKTTEITAKKKTRRKSTRAPSSSRFPPNPNKILLNAVLKTGKILKPPKHRVNLSKSKNQEPAPAPRPKKYFQCKLCPYRTQLNFQLEHHLREHESPEVVNHTCPHCTNPTRQFSHKQSFDYHMNSHAGQHKMVCDICPRFINAFAILEHLQGHPEVEKIFQCSGCSYRCGTREGYLKHIRFHGTAALICDVCSKTFETRQKLLRHMHFEHQLLEKVKCDIANCDKEYFETLMLTAHKKKHTEAFVCLECKLQFPSTRHLLTHQVREHSKEKPVACAECSETFIDKQSLQRHLINAHGAAKFKCPHCPKEYSSQWILNSHMNLHEGISFPCDKCDKSFRDRATLERHRDTHKTTKDFVCEECGKAFRYESLLKIHLKIHIADKKHKCSYCSKGFVDRKNLITHERIHTGEKPYVCEACGKDFNQRSALNVHKRTQHKELIAIENKSEVTAAGSTSTFIPIQDELNVG